MAATDGFVFIPADPIVAALREFALDRLANSSTNGFGCTNSGCENTGCTNGTLCTNGQCTKNKRKCKPPEVEPA